MSVAGSLLVLALGMLLTGGCSLHETWKETGKLYREYLNVPAQVDYEDIGSLEDAERRLASVMLPMDAQLERLERFLENQDGPSSEVVIELFQRFPWLSGVAVLNPDGSVLGQEPAESMKPLDFAALARISPRGNVQGLRGAVQNTPLGAEIFVVKPVYVDSDLRGFFVCHFDMRSLLQLAPDAGDIVVLTPDTVIWPGTFVLENTPLRQSDWAELARRDVEGTLSEFDGRTCVWMARFIGEMPLIFAAPAEGSWPRKVVAPQTPVTDDQVIEAPGAGLLGTPPPPVETEPAGPREQSIAD